MKKLIYILILIIGCSASYYLGRFDIYMAKDCHKDGTESIWYPHFENTRKSLSFEREYCNALFEGLHRFYSSDDNDHWFESFMHTKEYAKIDSLNQSDWEDFYYYETPILEDWYTNYGTIEEPSEIFKDTVHQETVNKLKGINNGL